MDVPNSKKTLKIKPIQIEPIKIAPLEVTRKNSVEEEHLSLLPIDILSKLKTASEESKEAIVSSQKEQSTDIVKSLTKKIETEVVENVAIQKIPKKVKTTKEKLVIKKKIALKKETKSKVKTKAKSNNPKKKSTPIKTFITSKNQKRNKLSREKEVALYNKTYTHTLEVVNVSDSFEIKEENTLPDSHYFEPIKSLKKIENNAPLEFVEKLGVVIISDKYESNFIVPQKIEVAKEGIVDFSSTSIETKELQKLEFVDTLGIIEVSEDFETINAKKYLD